MSNNFKASPLLKYSPLGRGWGGLEMYKMVNLKIFNPPQPLPKGELYKSTDPI